jgi:hypothetical protein
MASIGVPSVAGVTDSLQNYGVGVVAGTAYRALSDLLGPGIIAGAIAAAGSTALVKGPIGDMLAVSLGMQIGQNIGLMDMLVGG